MHQQTRIADLQAVLDEKIPADFLRGRARPSRMVIAGLVLVFVGLLVAAVGTIRTSTTGSALKTTKAQPAVAPPAPAPTSQLLPDDDGPIKWYPGSYLLGAGGGGDTRGMVITSLQFVGRNTSDEFIEPLSGFIRSEITGKQFPIFVVDGGNLVAPDGYGIPAKHQFNLAAKLSDTGISGAQFLKEFERMTFSFTYGKHTYVKHFTPEELDAEVSRTERDLRPQPAYSMAGVRRKSP